jgi:hypothetical protein
MRLCARASLPGTRAQPAASTPIEVAGTNHPAGEPEMSFASRIVTLMTSLTSFQVRGMPPLERMRLAHECRRLLLAAEPPVVPPRVPSEARPGRARSGVLSALHDGERSP